MRKISGNYRGRSRRVPAGAAPTPGYTLPALSTAKYQGDSRAANAGSRAVGAGLGVNHGMAGYNSVSLIQAVCGNKWVLGEGYQHGVGGSSTRAHEERDKSASIATTGNPAFTGTAAAADASFSAGSDSRATCLTFGGKHVVSPAVGVNDTHSFYNTPSPAWESLRTISRIADAYGAAGKMWLLGNEFPRGDACYLMESRTVSAGSCTAAHIGAFKDGESFGAVGVVGVFASGNPRPLVKVASSPAQDQYTVTSGGVYTFGGTAPTTAFITYNATPSGGRIATTTALKVIREFCQSSAANFVSTVNSVDYGLPGLLYQRPHVRVADTFGALVDGSTGSLQLSKPGTLDSLQLHGSHLSAYLTAAAFKAVVDDFYPAAPDLSTAPERNNWLVARGTGATTSYSGTLPPSMRSGFLDSGVPTLVTLNGVVIGRIDPGTGAITAGNGSTAISSGTLDWSTGAWSITTSSNAAFANTTLLWFEQDIGNYDVATFTEGTIGRNALMNGLLDMTAASGTNLATTTGASSITGINASEVPYGWNIPANSALNTAIGAGTMAVAVASETDAQGFPRFVLQAAGVHGAATTFTLQNATTHPALRLAAGDRALGGARVRYARHGTLGRTYGASGAAVVYNQTATGGVDVPVAGGTSNVSQLLVRAADTGTGVYMDDALLDAAGGALDLYRLTPQLELTGITIGAVNLSPAVTTAANVPFAYRIAFGRAQVRRRNDV